MEEESWKRNLRNLGRVIMEASGRHLETSGRHLETSGRHLGGILEASTVGFPP